jgi:hypothetical protein
MGDAEFAGGGSVTWAINHSDSESCNKHKNGAKGKDRCPRTESGMFVITVTGQEPIIVPVKGTTVRVVWGDVSQNGVVAPATTTGAARRKRVKAKTATA